MLSILKTNKKKNHRVGMVVHVFDHPSLGRQGQQISELEDGLIYLVPSQARLCLQIKKQKHPKGKNNGLTTAAILELPPYNQSRGWERRVQTLQYSMRRQCAITQK